MSGGLPAITPKQLVRILEQEGWEEKGQSTHGKAYVKFDETINRTRVTTIQTKKPNKSIPASTLHLILSPAQTNIGRTGLAKLIKKHGLK
jgi:predicted RNA binding protein YcfA (HicA-like mRNA interferase family)